MRKSILLSVTAAVVLIALSTVANTKLVNGANSQVTVVPPSQDEETLEKQAKKAAEAAARSISHLAKEEKELGESLHKQSMEEMIVAQIIDDSVITLQMAIQETQNAILSEKDPNASAELEKAQADMEEMAQQDKAKAKALLAAAQQLEEDAEKLEKQAAQDRAAAGNLDSDINREESNCKPHC